MNKRLLALFPLTAIAVAVGIAVTGCGGSSSTTASTPTTPVTPAAITANPYNYGIIPEVTVNADSTTQVVKHRAMGRGTWEMAKVMPDSKTVYLGDDGTHGLFTMFIADTAGDLSAGTLYAAEFTQTAADGADGGTADIHGNLVAGTLQWVKLGHATDAEVQAIVDSGVEITDIFDIVAADTTTTPPSCPATHTRVRTGSTADECLMLKPGMEQAAAFLETRRYAAMQGSTTEFTKMEGIAVNDADKKLYVAISAIRDSMTSMTGEPADHIRLKKNSAGATYTCALAAGQTDTDNSAIASEYVATNMYVEPALLGMPITADADGNTANVDSVANTDNVFYSEKMRTLFIGEDSGMHVNNYVWAYEVDSKQLKRILSSTAGAENTGLQAVEDMNGFAYIMSNNQHWGDFIGSMNATLEAEVSPLIDKFDAPVGYIGGMPALGADVAYVTFSNTPSANSTLEYASTYTTSKATVHYVGGSSADFPLYYNKLFGVKDKIAEVNGKTYAAGQLYNHKMEPLADPFGQPVIAETPDSNSLLKVDGKLFLVTHYEYDWLLSDGSEAYKVADWYTRMPMSMTLTELSQDASTGRLSVVSQHPIDFSSVNGLWIPCFGSQTPWNTHLGSEEDYDLQYNPLTSSYSTTSAGIKALNEVYFTSDHVLP